ncbi:DinB family protein [Flavobacteriaceae bacterium TP-CH-4]|uniref:DinB family protein n=1 Tax=Pelagihabitans pacificus TaxID=2696054 RepID=A0A967AS85_9FLAO|nr:DinB family protein [Pelagihabitans pacificus]NHF58520.1 DinB family protein [Pelagihabitans pacificus]
MLEELKNSLWQQFGASIDMLINALDACPSTLYKTNKRFFYMAYHAIVFLDYYLTVPPTDFEPRLPFTIVEKEDMPKEALDDVLPNEHYPKEQLLEYIKSSKKKCLSLIMSIKENGNPRFMEDVEVGKMDYSLIEILLYNLRHIQHHAAQLNMILRNEGLEPPKWVARVI